MEGKGAHRKFKADRLFTGFDMAEADSVLITSADGIVLDIVPSGQAGEGVEILEGVLCPGFVNCHCHLELSHMKGLIPEKTGLVDFLLGVMTKRDFSADIIAHSMAAAEKGMLEGGIVAVGDICNTGHSLELKSRSPLHYHNFIETMGFTDAGAPARFEAARKTFGHFAGSSPQPFRSNSIVPHAPYSVSGRLFGMITGLPGNRLLSIHNQETAAENEFLQSATGDFRRLYEGLGIDISFFTGSGRRSRPGFLPHFHKGQSLILVHNVDTNEEDLVFAKGWLDEERGSSPGEESSRDLFFCLCPNANLYISGQLPDINMLIRHRFPIVVGTDSLASNHTLSILEELKTLQAHLPGLPMETLLGWATANGAKALAVADRLGSFEKGRKPGMVLIENSGGERISVNARARRIL